MPKGSKAVPSQLRIAAAQMKFAPTIPENLEAIEQTVKRAARRGVDALLFPECATTGYACDFRTLAPAQLREALAFLSTLAARHQINLLVGSPFFRGRKLFNGLLVFDRQGRLVHAYAKCQLTPADREVFTPGNAVALFEIDGVPATAIICHERRYPELVRLAVMAGARILFHPNAGMDSLAVSRRKRNGRDGIAIRAFENAIFYVFANSVGAQGGGRWSAGDSKIVAPDSRVLRFANNRDAALIVADLDLAQATGKYARESLEHPRFLSASWRRMVALIRHQARSFPRPDGFSL